MPDVIQIAIQATDAASKIIGGVGDSLDRLSKQSEDADKKLKIFGLSTEQIGNKMTQAGKIATVGLTLPIAGLAVAATKAASDLNETSNKIQTLFGNATDSVMKFADTAATSLGQSKKQALDAAADFAVFGKAAGLAGNDLVDFSKQNVKLAADMASFFNTSPEEAITAIGAAFRGESEPIRRYGVLINEASLKDQALRMGLIKTTTEALQPQARVLAAQALIMQQTSAAQGDFAKTSDGLANQSRILNAQFQDMIASLGQSLLPIAVKVAGAANDLLTAFNSLEQPQKDLIVGFGLMAAAAGPVLTVGGRIVSTLGSLQSASINVGNGLISFGKTIGETAGYLKQVGVSSDSLKFAFQNLKGSGVILAAELGVIAAGLEVIMKFATAAGEAAKVTTDELIKMANSGDFFKQAGASFEIVINGQSRLNVAVQNVGKTLQEQKVSYDRYVTGVLGAAVAAGTITEAQAKEYLETGKVTDAWYHQIDVTKEVIEQIGLLSKAVYESTHGVGQFEIALRKLVDIGGLFATNVVPILTGRTKESSGAMRDQADAANTSIAAIEHADDVNKRYASTLGVTVAGLKAQKNALADTYGMAITYTESERKQADVQKELDDLNAKIAARGPVRVATIAAEATATNNLSAANTELATAQAAADDVMQRDNETRAQYAMRLKDAQTNLKKLTEQSSAYVPAAQAVNTADQKTIIDQARLAVAQEDLAKAQKKKGETDAEFILRVETLRGKISDYSAKLTEHTAVVGGATKAELEQKKALEEQIAALKQQDEVSKAKGAFDSLTKAFRDNIITQDQYRERAAALNAITGLYTQTALQQATAQEELMKSFSDPASEAWRSQLVINKDAIDGVVASTQKAAEATDTLNKKQAEAAKPTRAEARVEGAELGGPKVDKSIAAAQAALDYANKAQAATESARQSAELLSASQEAASREMKGATDVIVGGYKAVDSAIADTKQRTAEITDASIKAAQARSAADEKASKEMKGNATAVANAYKAIPKTAAAPPVITPKVDTKQAVTDITSLVTNVYGTVPKEKATTFKAETTTATANTQSLLRLFGTIPKIVNTFFDVDGKLALQTLDDIRIASEKIVDKAITITVNYVTHGSPPEGYQHGGAFTVPANPRGGMGDYFPVLAAPGERVTIQTPAQQHGTGGGVGASQDTYNYTTNIYNPLAAAMWADQQRREKIARSNARMGVV